MFAETTLSADAEMSVITTEGTGSFRDTRSKLLALLVVALGVAVALAADVAKSRLSCEFHASDLSNDFSPGFDIVGIDCRGAKTESPVLHIWGVRPFLGISWK